MIIKGRNNSSIEAFYHMKENIVEISIIDSGDGEASTAFFSLGKVKAIVRMFTKIITALEEL